MAAQIDFDPSVDYYKALGLPLMTWTVRTQAEREQAQAHADQMVFEGFVP